MGRAAAEEGCKRVCCAAQGLEGGPRCLPDGMAAHGAVNCDHHRGSNHVPRQRSCWTMGKAADMQGKFQPVDGEEGLPFTACRRVPETFVVHCGKVLIACTRSQSEVGCRTPTQIGGFLVCCKQRPSCSSCLALQPRAVSDRSRRCCLS
jgi:hypothetical protein